MEAKVKCPNSNCPAPPESFLIKHGFGSAARQVCGMQNYYTLLTERLVCTHCKQIRHAAEHDSESEDHGSPPQQYRWHAHSPRILMNLAPALRSMFPAILCGRRSVDKYVATLLGDRLNAISMAKVQRLLQQGHDEWYTERRDLYQTLLYQAHASSSSSSQSGILSFIKPSGSYTPPLPQTPLPSARLLRRAHLLMEMERIPSYRASILSVTGEILCIDRTRQFQILKKIYGDGQGTLQYVTSVLNEWGQFLTTVVVASESEGSYNRMARGLIARFKRANVLAPKVLYVNNNCCCDGGTSWYETLFEDWIKEGMVVRLDIRHWLHRWDGVVIKQSHSKYGVFISAMAGALLAYNKEDVLQVARAVRLGNEDLYSGYSDDQMLPFIKPHQLKSYVRRITRGVEETACEIERILDEFKGPAGLDVDGIPLFKSLEAVECHWTTASKHLSCMQDPQGIQLYVCTKVVTVNGVDLKKYRCRRGTNSLEGLHSHLYNAVPSQRCGITPFQVYLISFAVQWNQRMESLRVAGGRGRLTSCLDPRLIQRLNQHSEVLFGKGHLFEPNFAAPMPYPQQYTDPEEEELLGVEYAYCQSTNFKSKEYYVEKVDEEQSHQEPDESESEDEGVEVEEAVVDDDPIDHMSSNAALTTSEMVTAEESPALQDVLMSVRRLHLPGFEEVEALALALLELVDGGDKLMIAPDLRNRIRVAASLIHDHDKSVQNFTKKYESKWGYTLFGRCLGPESAENSAAQKTKFGWMRYAQSAQISEDSRLLYLVVKMLKNRPANQYSSPTKIANAIRGGYKRIVDRVRDDPVLCSVDIPLPNINSKSITVFLSKLEKKANYMATAQPKVVPHRKVFSSQAMPDAPSLPTSLPLPDRPEVQYVALEHSSGKRHLAKERVDVDEPKPVRVRSGSAAVASSAPVLVVVPAQPLAPSVKLEQPSTSQGYSRFVLTAPPPLLPTKPVMPSKSDKPCAACKQPKCGGLRKRYTPSKDKTSGSRQKIFTFCPTTGRSTTPGFDEVYDSFQSFKECVDAELLKRKNAC